MKTLKFTPEITKQILSGDKTTTWRLFDDKDLTEGDELEFINNVTLETFGTAKIVRLTEKTLGTLEEADWEGHEKYSSDSEMFETYKKYYGPSVDADTDLKIIHFEFTPNK